MRQHSSVLMLALRGSLHWVLLLLVLMSAVEGVLFWRAMWAKVQGPVPDVDFVTAAVPEGGDPAVRGTAEPEPRQVYPSVGLERAFTSSGIGRVVGAGLLALSAILCLNGCWIRGSGARYTIQRLSVSERALMVWWAAGSLACLLIFWAWQLGTMLLLCWLYLSHADPAYVNMQTVFLAFYRQPLLHTLLPLQETSRWVCNGVLFFSMAVTQACFSYQVRHGRKGVAAVVLCVVGAFAFARDMGGFVGDMALMAFAGVMAAVAFWNVWGDDGDEAD